jgi:ferredoxin
LTILTGAVKNSYGILPGAQKANGHRLAGNPALFNELIVDVFGIRVPDLFIVDAVVGMEGNGPVSTDLRDIGRILASDNAVALDATIARMMGIRPGDLRFLEIAKERGYGGYDETEIELYGKLIPIPGFKLPPSAEERMRKGPRRPGGGPEDRVSMRPKADDRLCTSCGTCVAECPVSALSMAGGLPVVDPDACIACYCCQENCPEKAIKLS